MIHSKAVEENSGPTAKGLRWSGLMPGLAGLDESADLISVLQFLLRLMHRAVPEHSAGIFLLDEETHTIQGQVTDLFDRELNVGHGALSEALRQDASYSISDLSDRRRAEPASIGEPDPLADRCSHSTDGAGSRRAHSALAQDQRLYPGRRRRAGALCAGRGGQDR